MQKNLAVVDKKKTQTVKAKQEEESSNLVDQQQQMLHVVTAAASSSGANVSSSSSSSHDKAAIPTVLPESPATVVQDDATPPLTDSNVELQEEVTRMSPLLVAAEKPIPSPLIDDADVVGPDPDLESPLLPPLPSIARTTTPTADVAPADHSHCAIDIDINSILKQTVDDEDEEDNLVSGGAKIPADSSDVDQFVMVRVKKERSFYINTKNKIEKETTKHAFMDVIQQKTMVYVSNNLSFAIFDGVMAGTLTETDDGDHIFQKYSRGNLLVIKSASGNAYDHFSYGTTFRLLENANGNANAVDMVIIGFTAHRAKENSCMVHMWCAKEQVFYRATGVNLTKHLESPHSPFECVRSTQPDRQVSAIQDARNIVDNYYRSTETVLKMESNFFMKLPTHSRSETLLRQREQVAKQAQFEAEIQEQEENHKAYLRKEKKRLRNLQIVEERRLLKEKTDAIIARNAAIAATAAAKVNRNSKTTTQAATVINKRQTCTGGVAKGRKTKTIHHQVSACKGGSESESSDCESPPQKQKRNTNKKKQRSNEESDSELDDDTDDEPTKKQKTKQIQVKQVKPTRTIKKKKHKHSSKNKCASDEESDSSDEELDSSSEDDEPITKKQKKRKTIKVVKKSNKRRQHVSESDTSSSDSSTDNLTAAMLEVDNSLKLEEWKRFKYIDTYKKKQKDFINSFLWASGRDCN